MPSAFTVVSPAAKKVRHVADEGLGDPEQHFGRFVRISES
jgi:hypothetical protein